MARAAVRRARGVGGRAARGRPAERAPARRRSRTCSRRASTPGTTAAWPRRRPWRWARSRSGSAGGRSWRSPSTEAAGRPTRWLRSGPPAGCSGNELGLDPGSDLVVLERSILSQDPSLAGDRDLLGRPADECPWKGLSSYDAEDQDAFFGRSAEIAEAPGATGAAPAAGADRAIGQRQVLPHARRARTGPGPPRPTGGGVHPGVDPAVAMSAARLGVPGDPVLLIDQFEETFTLAGPASDPAAWLAELASYAESRSPVVGDAPGGPHGAPDRVPGLRPDGGAGRTCWSHRSRGRPCGRPSRSRRAGPGCAWSTVWSTC